ncbi:LysR family transcriptional regulator [Ensifer sp. ENS10]|uniref:LysR family transcriptional regulator n=1 Tax=unclassified Ensifer TaxID=2633371 RepID=UPI000DDB26D2|nr:MULTISPECIES: LysR family transcriptional regulator [unclassified Ensifer]MBD9510661.1 LysR family transcriptional regulator [Ensifer sp. ENS10]MBV7517864.1 LysR family transcriptional regulator [Ensifer sp. ENS12]
MRPSLSELEAVTTIARLGGFRAAARELGVSSSALSHAVSALEERLDVRLFNRTTRSVALTAAGEAFVAEVLPALAAIDGAVERVTESRARPTGTLRLNTSPGAARMVLQPLLMEYLRRFPDMAVEVATDNALVDIVALGFDAGFRLTDAVPPDMIAVPVTRQSRMIVVGSPDYFRERAAPLRPADLMNHTCIRARMASGRIYHWEFSRHGESVEIDVPGRVILDESGLMLEAVLCGAGLAYLSDYAVQEHVAAGRLVRVLDEWTPPYDGLCLYFSGRRHVPAKLRALIELVRELRVEGGEIGGALESRHRK